MWWVTPWRRLYQSRFGRSWCRVSPFRSYSSGRVVTLPWWWEPQLSWNGPWPWRSGAAGSCLCAKQSRICTLTAETRLDWRIRGTPEPFLHCSPCCAFQRKRTAECTTAKRCWLNHWCPWLERSGCNSLAKSWLCIVILNIQLQTQLKD